jgi:hypothetical protein
VRTRVESWEWFKGNADNSYTYSGNMFRLGIGQQREKMEWLLEFELPLLAGLPDHAVAAGAQGQLGLGATYFVANDKSTTAALLFAKQGFIRFKRVGAPGSTLKVGRFEFIDGNEVTPKNATLAAIKRDRVWQRLIGPFTFTHVWRSFDGLQYVYDQAKSNFTLLAVSPTRGVFQVDGWGQLNISVIYGAFTRQISMGANTSELRLFAMQYGDWRDVLKTDNRALGPRRADHQNIQMATLGGHYVHALQTSAGTADVLFWGAWQAGKWGALDHRAAAIVAEAGFQPAHMKRLRPWIRGGYNYGSGDKNPNDSRHGTFFQVLPTARPYARFPFFNMMNNEDAFGELILRPHAKITIRSDVHSLRLASRNDLWYSGGGAFQPWTFGFTGRPTSGARGLATLYDSSIDYQLNPHVALVGYFGYAIGKSAIAAVYPKGKDGRLGYLELGYRF